MAAVIGQYLHQAHCAGAADGGPAERRFLDDVAVGQRRIDAPAVERDPARIGVAIGRIGSRSRQAIVGEPELGSRQVEFLCDLDKRVMLGRKPDLGLMPEKLFGQGRFADTSQARRRA